MVLYVGYIFKSFDNLEFVFVRGEDISVMLMKICIYVIVLFVLLYVVVVGL